MEPKLDREVGISYCGLEELYVEVLEDFYKLIDSKSEKIESLLASGDIRNYTIEVHALKSTARMIGATELSEMALEMEMAGNANDTALIAEKTPVLMSFYRAYKDLLAKEFGGNNSDDDKEEVPVSEIKAEIIRINLAVRDFDMDALDVAMAKLNKYKMPNDEAKKLVGELDLLVRDVAFEEIKPKIQELMSKL